MATQARWPQLEWEQWSATADTLHMWTQIIGKTRLALAPMQAHWWNVALYVSAQGLATSAMPVGAESLEIEFDFINHVLRFRLSTGAALATPLRAQSVAAFFAEYKRSLNTLGIKVALRSMPVELKAPIAFEQDITHASYDPEAANRFWRVLRSMDRVLQEFSAGFVGKVSPVHFFWGSFDLAVTRFSGKPAPQREGADGITREAYSHEVISAGFWPGNGGYGEAALYCYAAPSPEGLAEAEVGPAAARWDAALGEFVLPYAAVCAAEDGDAVVREFLESTYAAAAELAGWDRAALERG